MFQEENILALRVTTRGAHGVGEGGAGLGGQGALCWSRWGQPFPFPRQGSPSTMRAPQSTLTRDSVADLDEDFLKVGKVTPGRLEHVHKAVDEQVLHPADRDMCSDLRLPRPRPFTPGSLDTPRATGT